MAAQVRAAALANYPEVARQVGLDPRRMLRQAGLPAAALSNPDLRLPAAKVMDLLEASAEKSRCPSFGLRMAESRRLSDLGALGLLITHQPTLRDVLLLIVRYRQLVNEALTIGVEDADDLVIVQEKLVTERTRNARQSDELAVGTIFRLFRAFLGPRWQPYSVNFTHKAPADQSVHRRVLGPRVEFGSEFNGIVCAAADLDQPNPAADRVMARYAQQYLETLPKTQAGPITLDVKKAVYMLLPLGSASSAQIAQHLGINVRTLQRRLDGDRTSLSEVVHGVRRDLAVRYLRNRVYTLSQVSELLGYGQLSSFSRWFALQFGTSPSQWREKRRTSR